MKVCGFRNLLAVTSDQPSYRNVYPSKTQYLPRWLYTLEHTTQSHTHTHTQKQKNKPHAHIHVYVFVINIYITEAGGQESGQK